MSLEGPFASDIPVGVVGCDFRRGSNCWRSLLVLSKEEREQLSHDFLGSGIVDGLVFLDTCNRNEWLFASRYPAWAGELLKAQMIKRWRDMEGVLPQPYLYTAGDAVRHMLRVAAGLESFVVGERQILTQLSRALEAARSASTSCSHLNKLGAVAATVAGHARRQGMTSGGLRGVHEVASCYVAQHVAKPSRALVLGTGEIGRRVAASLGTIPGLQVRVMNRTVAPGPGSPLPLADLTRTAADVAVVCTSAPAPVITPRRLPIGVSLILDLGIPCQVDPAVGEVPGVTRVDLDDLMVDTSGGVLSAEGTELASRLVEQGLGEFAEFCAMRRVVTLLEATRRNKQEFIATFLPGFVDQLLPQADGISRARMETSLRVLIRRYTASILESIHESIAREGLWGSKPTKSGTRGLE